MAFYVLGDLLNEIRVYAETGITEDDVKRSRNCKISSASKAEVKRLSKAYIDGDYDEDIAQLGTELKALIPADAELPG